MRVGERDSSEGLNHSAIVSDIFRPVESAFLVTPPCFTFVCDDALTSGGMSCEAVLNEPEFHMLECGMGAMLLNQSRWRHVYPSVGESNRERCLS